jgi:hypothetical protein
MARRSASSPWPAAPCLAATGPAHAATAAGRPGACQARPAALARTEPGAGRAAPAARPGRHRAVAAGCTPAWPADRPAADAAQAQARLAHRPDRVPRQPGRCPLPGRLVAAGAGFEAPGCRALRVRSARCRSHVPDGVPRPWQRGSWPPGRTAGQAPGAAHLGTRTPARDSADVRLDLVSVLPQRWPARRCRRTALLKLASSRPGPSLPAARTGTDTALTDLCGAAVLTDVQRPYTAVRGVRWDGRWHDPAQRPAHYSALAPQQRHAAGCPAGPPTLAGRCRPTCPAAPMPSACTVRAMRAGGTPASSSAAATRRASAWRCCCPPSATWPIPMRWRTCAARWSRRRRMPPRQRWTAAPGLRPLDLRAPPRRTRRAVGGQPPPAVERVARPPALAVVADSWLLDWLDRIGQPFDVITDHDLHRLGAAALAILPRGADRATTRNTGHADVGRPVALPAIRRGPPDVPGRQRPVLAHRLRRLRPT